MTTSRPFSVVNPLAAPKGVKLTCELCQKPARLQCCDCRVTFYCCEGHQLEDWRAIHEKICGLVSVLHGPQPHSGTAEERAHHEHQQTLRKKHIVGVALEEGRRLLYSGQASLAIPASLQVTAAVRYLTELGSTEVGGAEGAVDIAPAYLILSEAAIQLGRLSEAEQYLSQVQWLVLQSPSSPPSLLASLHRNLGQLASARGRLSEARRHFAEDVYQSSVAHGTESPQAAGGYFHMASVFFREGRQDIAASLHDQVIEAWHSHLSQLLNNKTTPLSHHLDVGMQAEAMYILQSVCDLRQRSSQTPPTPLLLHTLALLYHVAGDNQLAVEAEQKAIDLCNRDDDLFSSLKTFMDRLTELIKSP